LRANAGTTVTCNFQPQCDPLRQSDWRACLVAVSTNLISANNPNQYASYSELWNTGANSITLSADQNQLYLVVIATPRAIGTEVMSDWWAYLEFAGLQFPYAVSFSNAPPLNVVEVKPTGVTWKNHTNAVDGTICMNIAGTATVAGTAYVSSNAMVLGSAQVLGSASIQDYGVVRDSAQVSGNAVVSGHGEVRDTAQVYGYAKVRDWGRVFGNAQVYGYAKVIEHANCGDSGNVVSGSAIIKGTTYVYSPSTFNGCLIMDGDSANGTTTPASYGVHFGWQWGQNPSIFTGRTNNNYQYCGLTFENTQFTENNKEYGISNNPVFALDQYGINHGFLMNGCRAAIDTGAGARGGYVLSLNGTNQYVELHNSVNDFNDTTIAVWFKNNGGPGDQRIWSLGDGGSKMMYLTPNDSDTGNLRFLITDGNTTNDLNGSAVPANVWTHVAVVFAQAASNSVLYVNGVAVATNSAITLFPDSLNAPLMANANYLGRGNTGNYFQGSLDDFRVFMRSFDASEVLALYNTPAPAPVLPVADTPPPTPTWLVIPTPISDSAITMSANPATSALGWSEYYFQCTSGGGHDSGWVSFNKYTDCSLAPGTACTYTVKMRDQSGNITSASTASSASTLTSSVSSGSASFAYSPVGVANGQITMTATGVTNASGKTEYAFTCTAGGGHSSGWIASPVWTDSGLTIGGSYTYTVTVRDGRGNASIPSAGVAAKAADYAAPQFPSFQQGQWATMPYPTITNSISMTTQTATDPSGVQYYFHCVSGGGPDSGWQTSPTFRTPALPDGTYVYQYQLRDQSARNNTNTSPSTSYAATIKPTTGYHAYTLSQVVTNPDDYLVSFPATVMRVSPTDYFVKDLASGAAITVEPNTSNLVTVAGLALNNVTVQGHLYTRNGSRIVTYSALTSNGVPTLYTISGKVTNSHGIGISGATVYFADSPNASSNSIVSATSDASGNYSEEVTAGTWYVAAGDSAYNTSADQTVVVTDSDVAGLNFGLAANAVIQGVVTRQSGGTPVAGVSVYFSSTSNASVSPSFTATTGADGTYAQAVQDGVWYVAAGGAGFWTTPDLTVTVADLSVSNINIALRSSVRNIPQTAGLLFSVVTESLPASGPVTPWPTYSPPALLFVPANRPSPTVQQLAGVKWAENYRATSTRLELENPAVPGGNYSAPIPLGSGATIVLAAQPIRYQDSQPWVSIVDVFYSQLCLGVKNDTGQICVRINDSGANNNNTITLPASKAIPAAQATIISLVVSNNGSFGVYTNGTQIYTGTATWLSGPYTQLTPGVNSGAGGWADYIDLGGNDPDGWPAFNGYIGDVFVYTNALAVADRQQLEADLSAKFRLTDYQITASANAGGTLNPSGTVYVGPGGTQTFSITPAAGNVISNVVVDEVAQGAISTYTFTNVTAPHSISAAFRLLPVTPPALTISANSSGGLDIAWPDTYTGQLLWSPTLGPGAVWNPVGGTPAHAGGFYKVSVTLGPDAAFYGLGY
jgi:hypothetical protein